MLRQLDNPLVNKEGRLDLDMVAFSSINSKQIFQMGSSFTIPLMPIPINFALGKWKKMYMSGFFGLFGLPA